MVHHGTNDTTVRRSHREVLAAFRGKKKEAQKRKNIIRQRLIVEVGCCWWLDLASRHSSAFPWLKREGDKKKLLHSITSPWLERDENCVGSAASRSGRAPTVPCHRAAENSLSRREKTSREEREEESPGITWRERERKRARRPKELVFLIWIHWQEMQTRNIPGSSTRTIRTIRVCWCT